MKLPFNSKKNILYFLIIFTAIILGAVVYFKQLYSLFNKKDGSMQVSETFDIDEVRVKKLNTDIFNLKQFQELKEPESNNINIDSLNKGKRNPFLP